jgi:hypothetical protein
MIKPLLNFFTAWVSDLVKFPENASALWLPYGPALKGLRESCPLRSFDCLVEADFWGKA